MRLGLVLPLFSGDPAKVLAAAVDAEEMGFDGVFAFDHFFPPGASPDRPSLEAFTTLGAVAALTARVAIGTLVTRAVLRPAGLLAKMAATLDAMSDGRMILGIGTGDPLDAPEHHAFGFPDLSVAERREHLGETVAAVKALLRGATWAGGARVPPLAGPILPGPVRPGGPPVWLGGQADAVVRIAAGLADGWNGWGMEPARFRQKADLLVEAAAGAGRAAEATWAGIVLIGEDEAEAEELAARRHVQGMMDALGWVGGVDRFGEFLQELSDAGATWAIVVPAGPPDRRALLAERVIPTLRGSDPAGPVPSLGGEEGR